MLARLALLLVLCTASLVARANHQAYVVQLNGNFSLLDIESGATSTVSTAGTGFAGLAFGPGNLLYAATVAPVGAFSTLSTIDPLTGVSSPVGSVGFRLSTLTSLSDGRLFGVDEGSRLITVDPATGVGSIVGSTGLPLLGTGQAVANSLASDGGRLLYTLGFGISGDASLYTLDISSGSASLVGATHAGLIYGSVYASTTESDGELFGFGFDASGERPVIYRINTSNGAASFVSIPSANDIYGGVGITTSVPEPASAAALALGGALVCGVVILTRRPHRRRCA